MCGGEVAGFQPAIDVARQHAPRGSYGGEHQGCCVGEAFCGACEALGDRQHRIGVDRAGDDGDDAAVTVAVEQERECLGFERLRRREEEHTQRVGAAAHGGGTDGDRCGRCGIGGFGSRHGQPPDWMPTREGTLPAELS